MVKKILLITLVVLVPSTMAYAAAAANKARMQKQQQMMMQQKIQQQIMLKQQAMIKQAVQQKMQGQVQNVVVQRQLAGGDVRAELLLRQKQEIAQGQAKAVATIGEVLQSLKQSGRDWTLIMDAPAKEAVVSYFIDQYRQKNIQIHKAPSYYADMIDQMATQTPQMLIPPFDQVLKVVAIVEYDFDNGQDKDAQALKILGNREAMMKNRERLGLPGQN